MKLKIVTLALAFAAVPAYAAMGTTDIPTFAGQAAAQAAAKTATPKTPEEWLARMTDFSRNLSAFKDPKVFVPWANAVTEPSFYIAMMNGMMDPGGWLNMMNSAAHPDAVRNLVQFGDPGIYLKWTAAGLDPAFYTALLTQLSDPGKMMRWAMVPVDPKLWNVMLNTLNPNTYIRWGMAGMDPRAWNLAGTMANPALYTGMAGAIVNPNSYGQGTNSWLTWAPAAPVQGAGSFAMWDPVAMLGNLSGFIPGVNLSALPTLPNIGLPSFPTQAAPAPAPAATPAPTAVPAPAVAPAPVAPKSEVKPAAPVTAAVEAPKPEVKPAITPVPAAAKAVEAPKADAKPAAAAPAKAVEVPKAEVKTAVVTPATVPAAAPAPNKVILAGDALFQSGKSGIRDLSKEGKAKLDEVVAKLKGMGEIEQIKVVGHADPTGKAAVNQKLSEARAKSIKSYLVAKGVKPNVVMSTGMGDTQAVVQCDKSLPKDKLKECHAPNRRVEIEIVAKTK
jgi:outer membrane protein OmpA-like peptidoglycan-associated protein